MSGLFEGHSYYFRVRAVNSHGISKPSRMSDAIAALDPSEFGKLHGGSERSRLQHKNSSCLFYARKRANTKLSLFCLFPVRTLFPLQPKNWEGN